MTTGSKGPLSTGEAIRGPSRSSTDLDPERMAQTDPFETFMPPPAAGGVAQEAVIRVRLLVMLADRLTSVRLAAPLHLSDPVWSHDGMICTGETYKSVVKLTFAKGASLKDPSGLFNSSLEGNARRAIDLNEGDEVDGDAFKTLIHAAVALNRSSAR